MSSMLRTFIQNLESLTNNKFSICFFFNILINNSLINFLLNCKRALKRDRFNNLRTFLISSCLYGRQNEHPCSYLTLRNVASRRVRARAREFTTNSVHSMYVPIYTYVCTRNTRVFTQQATHAWRRWRYDANVFIGYSVLCLC